MIKGVLPGAVKLLRAEQTRSHDNMRSVGNSVALCAHTRKEKWAKELSSSGLCFMLSASLCTCVSVNLCSKNAPCVKLTSNGSCYKCQRTRVKISLGMKWSNLRQS